MTRKNNRRTDLLAREFQELPYASLQQIGNELQNDLNEAIAEPLPDKFRGLLRALEAEISQKNDPFTQCRARDLTTEGKKMPKKEAR